ncbi:hypothetical protein [Thermacetogenium phaeum]|uniref:hypothetical protein n=1 Tax=Thermacetogenium phaeum TaxID=85874 RepID=UPI0011D22284|nr:hypothetical protein [Thermacetogenium phaeum]
MSDKADLINPSQENYVNHLALSEIEDVFCVDGFCLSGVCLPNLADNPLGTIDRRYCRGA